MRAITSTVCLEAVVVTSGAAGPGRGGTSGGTRSLPGGVVSLTFPSSRSMVGCAPSRLITRAWDSEATRHAADLSMCPTILQERIVGPADVRATMIGSQIFSACIHTSQGRAEIDSRLDPDVPFTAYELPASVEAALLRLMDELGLVFGTVDLKVATSGEHVFLEINPQGQFLYVEIHTGLPISDALVEYLASV